MLKQLIKLDFLWCNHSFLYIAGADLLSALLTRLSTNWESSLGSFMRHFFSSLTITLFFSLSLNVLARLIINFKNKTFRDESYLFRTLPVKASELWNAKVLSSVLLVLSVSAAILLCLAVSTLTPELWDTFKALVRAYPLEILLFVLLVFLELCSLNLCIFDGILLGHQKSQKPLWSILSVAGLYIGIQLLLLALLFLLSRFLPAFSALFSTADGAIPDPAVLAFALVYYLFTFALLYLLGRHTLASGLDVN